MPRGGVVTHGQIWPSLGTARSGGPRDLFSTTTYPQMAVKTRFYPDHLVGVEPGI